MPRYDAPLADMQFLLHEVFKVSDFWQANAELEHLDRETVDMVLEQMAKFAKNTLLPLNRSGDEEEARYQGDGVVTTPAGFKEAFAEYAEGGWIGLGGNPEYGGQGLPKMVTMLAEEMMFTANQAFALYPNLSTGASLCLNAAGSEQQKSTYLEKIYSGEWTGTMCLTEPHAGTDLGIIKTRAEPNDDGSYRITGTKIFITAGEHDLSDNIIHLVLAKTPNAPAGSKGISLFVVPKFLVNEDGSLGERNHVQAGSIEHKMGIKASATCVMNFDGATGYLVGAENTGLASMFIMMNYERLTISLQGIGGAELAYQNAVAYTVERLQGRSDTAIISPEKSADAIIHHADVRRMLLNAKSTTEASRCFAMYVAKQLDIAKYSQDDAARQQAQGLVALLTPVAKAFLTDKGFAAAIDCQQCFGGHGYIREWGMEQIVRDTRIGQIYEGTNGIQALDLLGRKVAKDNAVTLHHYLDEMQAFAGQMQADHAIKQAIIDSSNKLKTATEKLLSQAQQQANTVNACAVDYLHALGYVSFAYMFGLMVEAAHNQTGDFYQNKAKLADYFIGRVLPQLDAHLAMIASGSEPIMAFDLAYFADSV